MGDRVRRHGSPDPSSAFLTDPPPSRMSETRGRTHTIDLTEIIGRGTSFALFPSNRDASRFRGAKSKRSEKRQLGDTRTMKAIGSKITSTLAAGLLLAGFSVTANADYIDASWTDTYDPLYGDRKSVV